MKKKAAAKAPAMSTPPSRSVISRVVEQVRDTPGSIGRPVPGITPGRKEEESGMGGTGGGDLDSDMNDEF